MKNILLVSHNSGHQALIADAINQESCTISRIVDSTGKIEQSLTQPSGGKTVDIVILDLDGDGSDTFPMIQALLEKKPLPVVFFVSRGDRNSAINASAVGISAYVVQGLDKDRIEPILAAAVTRFEETRALREELARTKNSLQERKIIERAKGLLMELQGCSENEAFRSMRSKAMSNNKRLQDIARGIIENSGLPS